MAQFTKKQLGWIVSAMDDAIRDRESFVECYRISNTDRYMKGPAVPQAKRAIKAYRDIQQKAAKLYKEAKE